MLNGSKNITISVTANYNIDVVSFKNATQLHDNPAKEKDYERAKLVKLFSKNNFLNYDYTKLKNITFDSE